MNRRNFIKLIGGGAVVALSATALSRSYIFGVPPSAVAAWNKPEEKDIRRLVLAYALLAPNPHNMQPWLADIRTPEKIILSLDTTRLLPATDPFGRQILMGSGAFLELLTMAAAAHGYRADVTLFPEGEPEATLDTRPFATINLTADATVQADPLFEAVLGRRTDRRSYDITRPIAVKDAAALQTAVGGLPVNFGLVGRVDDQASDMMQLTAIRTIVREAWRIELTTEKAIMESFKVLRIGSDEIDQHRDGIALTKPMPLFLAKTGLFDRNQFPSPDSAVTSKQIKSFEILTEKTPAYLWLTTQGNRRTQQIEAGRAYVRVNLVATQLGIALHPNEQALQEYPEVASQYQAIHALLNAPAPDFTIQMLARAGYLPTNTLPHTPAPRRNLENLLVL